MPHSGHTDVVNRWIEKTANGLSSGPLVHLFEHALNTLCERAYITLGDVTLTAIVDRVLHNAAEEFPLFESIEVGTRGVNCQRLLKAASSDNETDLCEGIRFVLVEFLVVIGNLTAEVLTPALHSELQKVAFKDSGTGLGESSEGN